MISYIRVTSPMHVKNNQFQKKLLMQKQIYEYVPLQLLLLTVNKPSP